MSNPRFDISPCFGASEAARNQRERLGATPTPASHGTDGATATVPLVVTDYLEQAAALPGASARETGRMTYDAVVVKASLVLGTIVLFGANSWHASSLGVGKP